MNILYTEKFDRSSVVSDKYLRINSCGIQKNFKDTYTIYRKNGRIDYHILYIAKGTCSVFYNENEFTLRNGDFVLYYPNETQKYIFFSDNDVQTYWIHFTGNLITELLSDIGLSHSGIYRGCDDTDIRNCFMRMIVESRIKQPYYNTTINGIFIDLISRLARRLSAQKIKSSSDKLTLVLMDMHKTYNGAINNEKYMQICNLSRSQFISLFKKHTGLSPYKYVLELRLAKAKELLRDSDLTILQISDSVGFNDPLYFSRFFKKSIGVSPSEYRNSL